MDLDKLSKEELLAMVKWFAAETKKKDETIAMQKIQISNQEERILKLEAEFKEVNTKLQEYIKKYEDKKQTLDKVIADTFASKSEKLPKEAEAINEVEALAPKEKKTRKSSYDLFINDLKELQSVVIIEDYEFEDEEVRKRVKPFGKDETYKIEMEPMSFKVVKHERPKYKDKDYIYQKTSDDVFPHSPLTPSLAANIIEMKYNLAIPLYRYAMYMNSFGLGLSPQDLSNYVMRTMAVLEPLYKELEVKLVNTKFKVIHGDETDLKVVDSEKEKCYMFVYATSLWDSAVYIYKFSETRKISNTVELLNNFNGYYECDGYPGYDSLPESVEGKIKIQRCWVHQRRYFFDCIKSLPKVAAMKSPAYNVIKKIDEMFAYEAKMREEKYTKIQIEKERNSEKYQKIIKDIDETILAIKPGSNTYLKKAVNHYINDKNELYTFLEDGYIDICNSLAERVVKPFVIARKNFLFCKTANGAEVTGKMFSIVQTARANGLRSELYLKYVLENIGKTDISKLLPWSNELPKELRISQFENNQ